MKFSVGLQDINDQIDHVFDGQDALDMIIENVKKNNMKYCDYNLILMDCNMPVMDGYQATRKIREFLYENRIKQPIISAVTGHTEQLYVDKAISSGMNQVLSKPVPIEILKDLVTKLKYSKKFIGNGISGDNQISN